MLIVVSGILLLFRQAFIGMATIGWTSETLSYGLVVVLVSAFLVWERRRALLRLSPRPDWKPIPLMLLAGLVWLLAHVLTVPWLEQFAAVALLILSVWHWYRVGGRYTDSPHVARLVGLWSSLVKGRTDAALIVVAAPYQHDPEQGAVVLGSFIDSMLPAIDAEPEHSRRNRSG